MSPCDQPVADGTRLDAWAGRAGFVVLLAANHWDLVPLQDRHLAAHLSAIVPVLYVEPAVSKLTPHNHQAIGAALAGPRLRLMTPSLARLTPVGPPGPRRAGVNIVTNQLVAHAVRAAVQALGGHALAVISTNPLTPLLHAVPGALRVHWAQDDFVGGARLMRVAPRRMRAGERTIAGRAQLVIAANPIVADQWRARGHDPIVVPYGCDIDHFAAVDDAPLPTDVDLSGPVAGFVGHLNSRTNLALLEAVADREISLLIVGPRDESFEPRRVRTLLSRDRVNAVGPKPFSELPSYHRLIDVGLVPYADSPFNRGSFPLKTIEYLAAGRPVVASDLPATRSLGIDLVTIASQPDAFATAVDQWLAPSAEPTSSLRARCRAAAESHSWADRAIDFARSIGITTRTTPSEDQWTLSR
jgi:glycosyltransferase involved in cell wall biosynthesis